MKRYLPGLGAIAFVFLLTASLASAQANPTSGTWKLNVAKSKSGQPPLPKSLTRTSEPQPNGSKLTYKGVAADGSPIAFTFTVMLDGKEAPITGTGQPLGADTISAKRIDASTVESTLKKDGKVVGKAKTWTAEDGKTLTITYSDPMGMESGTVLVYDKQ
jgi:hypothetical protein